MNSQLMKCPFDDGPLYSFHSDDRMADHLEAEHDWSWRLITAYLNDPWLDNGVDRDVWFVKSALKEYESNVLVPAQLRSTGRQYWTHLWNPYVTQKDHADLGRCLDCPYAWDHQIHNPIDWFGQTICSYWWEFPEVVAERKPEPEEPATSVRLNFTEPEGVDALKTAIRRMAKLPRFNSEAEAAEAFAEAVAPDPVEELTAWWLKRAEDEARAVVPKAVEYGSNSLMQLGRKMAQMQGREVSNEEALELGCWVNTVQKVERWTDAVMRGDRPSDDTPYDIGIYVKMAQRIRDVGSWPGVDLV